MTPPMLLYLETNWLVSCILRHDRWHAEARTILEGAQEGKYVLRVPEVALLEARHVVEREIKKTAKAIVEMQGLLLAAAANIKSDEEKAKCILEAGEKLTMAEEAYREQHPTRAVEQFRRENQNFISSISNPVDEQRQLEELRALSNGFQGKDIVDLYILGAVVADRARDRDRPAAFISTNEAEFAVDKHNSKLPRDFYGERKLLYLSRFGQALGAKTVWEKREREGWPPSLAPNQDERVKEAKSLLDGLPEHARDRALAALREIEGEGPVV